MAPLIKPMFKSDRNILETHFHELISIAVNDIEHFEYLRPSLLQLGRKHLEYGVKISHFSIVKSAFMLSLQYHLKGQFDDAMDIAWSKYVDIISQTMIEGLTE
jgi:hemoglobin-like flavoprotein